MNNVFVSVLMGSDSDLSVLQETFNELKQLGIRYEARILSAHRTPSAVVSYVQEADQRGCAVFIAAAGLAAHLAGAVAANTIKPVIGIPLDTGSLGGIDALLATVQMPGGTPVACTSIGKAGAKNAAHLAAQILAITDKAIADKLNALREEKRDALRNADKKLQAETAHS
ncbi:MAG: 5-(carboxyamino)imidazole ribonucleotide mutase [Coxiella sp. RIFCSPHIGHO2_12_FULL_42_15]|nr:MAG: 5-(carboxyamino)imidazole ribonucleotide mutase [Coxiella sp. RIFCSPHIGHO2_12_FULL_42_15]